MLFRKVMVANRGEIAVRILRSLRELGIRSAAIFSDADREALHVAHADEAYRVGPGPSAESYLHIERVVGAAKKSGAEAIHPGYGFLSENPEFAAACEAEKIAFIGPGPEAMRIMGNKVAARRRMVERGVPVIPGAGTPLRDAKDAREQGRAIGFPVLLKAAAGGGGKGMRIVREEAAIESALERTRSEAEKAFGDGTIFLEKYIESPRHIEVQILADRHGNVLHLGERECSVQRRFQKVIEESPSPVVDEKLRQALGRKAVEAARAVGYLSAGTVEFVMGKDRAFYFLEMNTRLQVEHPITEAVTGIDLVREQVRIAAGETLARAQESIVFRGHAIEFRIYAEDPAHGFLPSAGKIRRLNNPSGPGIRNDSGIYAGYEVPILYDPLLAKLVVWAEDRPHCIARARRALGEYAIKGIRHNIPFHLWALKHERFRSGDYDTHFIDETFHPEMLQPKEWARDVARIAAAIRAHLDRDRIVVEEGPARGPWKWVARREGLRGDS
ncbi:MAG: acetyl-CoA carboxylase biotin carboxylase subunit [Candidatus Eisenbacteria bacterium]|nr:acetyl-CoA carboxylase biotin carboxylase subunit [Candidatus Eisenbacteria bacterium]